MKIQLDENYHIRDGYGTSFELVYSDGSTITRKDKGGNEKVETKVNVIATNPIPLLIDEYIKIKLKNKHVDSVISLQQYVDEFKAIRNELLDMFKD